MVAKVNGVKKTIKKVETLQHEYNEFNQAHFKGCNDLKTLQNDYNWLMKDYEKMETKKDSCYFGTNLPTTIGAIDDYQHGVGGFAFMNYKFKFKI